MNKVEASVSYQSFGYGFTTAWVNRSGEPMDRMPWEPKHVLRDLTDIPKIIDL